MPSALLPADERFAARRPVAEFDPDCPPHLGLIQLAEMGLQEMQRLARSLSCHQDIASTSAFSLGMLAEFESVTVNGQNYRNLLREAGMVGQVLYLEAEAAEVRGTGIGCFFDDPVHQLIGLSGTHYQSVYHFTVGTPINDERIETGPPYPQRQQEKNMSPQLAAFLAEHGFQSDNINALQADGRFTPLMRASKLGQLDIVDELLALGVELNALNADGCNALWLACYNGSHELIERLITAGVNIDQQNGNGASCLMYVSSNSKPDLVKLLLEKGANPNLRNFDDSSALDLAASLACLKLLRKAA